MIATRCVHSILIAAGVAVLASACGSVARDEPLDEVFDASSVKDGESLVDAGVDVGSAVDTGLDTSVDVGTDTPADVDAVDASDDAEVILCAKGFANCDGLAENGCEVELATDPMNCSACGTSCPAPPNSTPTCVAAVCGSSTCKSGFVDCDGDPTTGCEAEVAFDAKNCGACANDCGSIPCWKSACLPTESIVDSNPTGGVGDLDVVGPNLYWVNSTGLYTCPKQGGPITKLAAAWSMTLDHDDASIYFGADALYFFPVGGGTILDVDWVAPAYKFAAEDGYVFWTGDSLGLNRTSAATGITNTVITDKVVSVDAHAGYVYWSASAGIVRQAVGGGAAKVVAQPTNLARSVRANDDWVVFLELGPQPGTPFGPLRKAPVSGGTPQDIASAYAENDELLVDEDYAYFPAMVLTRVSLTNMETPRVLANEYPYKMTQDATHIYFTSSSNIVRVPKDP